MKKSEKALILNKIEAAVYHQECALHNDSSTRRYIYCEIRAKVLIQLATDLEIPMDEITNATTNGLKQARDLFASVPA